MNKYLASLLIASACVLAVCSAPVFAVNTVTVSSAEATPNQTNLVIPVFLRNDVTLRNINCPLMVRKIGPSYVNALKLDNSERLLTALNEIVFTNHYNQGTTDTAACKRFDPLQPKSPGGFLGNPHVNSTETQTVTGVPYGILFENGRIQGSDLAPGSDFTGSHLITVDINDQEGCFEIDTTCIDPSNSLLFADLANHGIVPNFAQGVVHVGACQGTAMPGIDPVSLSPTDSSIAPGEVTFSWAPVSSARAYELEIDTANAAFNNLFVHCFVQTTEFTVTVPGTPGVPREIPWRVRAAPYDCGYCFGPWAQTCGCPRQSDFDEDDFVTAIDLAGLIDILYAGNPDVHDPLCPAPRGDFDCDGFSTALDLTALIDYLFAGGAPPCNPCAGP